MYHVDMGQPHNSMGELIQPSLSPFEEGNRPMHHSICLRRNFGEEYAHVNNVSFDFWLHYFTMYMQAMTPMRIIVP